jgi:alpha-glucoside transport system permease protein
MTDKETAAPAAGDENPSPAGTAVSTPSAAGPVEPVDETTAAPGGGRRGRTRMAQRVLNRPGLFFLLPALLLLGVLVVWPIIYTVWRSFYGREVTEFVGLDNYKDMFTDDSTLTAIKNNVIWVVVAPVLVVSLGLMFAVLTERIRWATAFKTLVFLPMAISFLAVGVIFRFVYDEDPNIGVLNAALVGIHDIFKAPSEYTGARPRDAQAFVNQGGTYTTTDAVSPAQPVPLGLVGLPQNKVPSDAAPAATSVSGSGLRGVVWLDFAPGGAGQPNAVDPKEKGLPGVKVQAVQNGQVVGSTSTEDNGSFVFDDLTAGSYNLRLPESNFAPPFNGVTWLGPTLVTWSIIASYIWMWAGFAMVLIAAGLAAIPREALEAARVDGATEFQVFRRVTMPLLAPVLIVVLVTLIINVLKIFDLVYIIAPASSQPKANVLALQMYLTSFGGGNNQGLGSAIAIFLFVLVVPAMIFNIRRFRREQQ